MPYTMVFKGADGSVLYRQTLDHPTLGLKRLVMDHRREFLDTEGAMVFEVLDSQGKLKATVTRQEFDTGTRLYRVEFVGDQWIPTDEKDHVAAWSLLFAVAVAKEMMPHHPAATGFQLVDLETAGLPHVGDWDPSHDLAA